MSRTLTAIRGLTLGAIVVACAAGCSLISPSAAPNGLQRQISQGAKVDAEGRSAKASTASRVRAKPSTAERTAAEVPGKDITAVGDSVMLAVSLPLQQAFPGIHIDAVVSRFMSAGLSEVQQLAASGGW